MDVGGWGLQVKRALERQVRGMGFPVVGDHDAGDEGGDGQEAGGEQQAGRRRRAGVVGAMAASV